MGVSLRRFLFSLILGAGASFAAPSFAAPQILALVETKEPVELRCADGTCRASFSTLCLQKERDVPPPGTVYLPASVDSLTLVVTSTDGRTVHLRAAGIARVATERNYASVSIAVDAAVLAPLNPERVALAVAPHAALVPMPTLGDPAPLTRDEIARVTGATRLAATRALKTAEKDTVAAAATQRLINVVSATQLPDAEAALRLSQDILAVAPEGREHPGVQRAKAIAGLCRWWSSKHSADSYLDCLRDRHDEVMFGLTERLRRHHDIGS